MDSEKELYFYLENLKNKPIKAVNGEYTIIEFGQRNFEEGPDFCNALIQIDNTMERGGIELHLKAKDWYRHYHHVNPRYNRVLLHLVWKNDLPVKTVFNYDGKPVPTVSLQDLNVRRKKLLSWDCPHRSLLQSPPDLAIPGYSRYTERLERFKKSIAQSGWEEALHQQIFRSLMYRKNIHLPVLVSWSELKKKASALSLQDLEYYFFHQYGFYPPSSLPDDYSREYQLYSTRIGENPQTESFPIYGCRPYNYPLRRIAGLLAMYDYFSCDPYGRFRFSWQTAYKDSTLSRLLYNVHKEMDEGRTSYWHFHSSWGKKTSRRTALIGYQRWKNVFYNSLLPFFEFRARSLNDLEFAGILKQWIWEMPVAEENYKERFISGHIGFKPQNAIQQYGLLHMYSCCFAGLIKQCSHCLELITKGKTCAHDVEKEA